MILFWKVRYFDQTEKQFKDRRLYLDTKLLDSTTRAKVELVADLTSTKTERSILKYRALFKERVVEDAECLNASGGFKTIFLTEYFEDAAGNELSHSELAQSVTGSRTALLIPPGAEQHDIDFMLSAKQPVPLSAGLLLSEEARVIFYFVREWKLMQNSAFMQEGPGSLTLQGTNNRCQTSSVSLKTAITAAEIDSFVTIFRRLYMTGEPACFGKAIQIMVKAFGEHPYGKWMEGSYIEYLRQLDARPATLPILNIQKCTFITKRLIDVFIYTQCAHQPDDRRERQYRECLAQVDQQKDVLTWLFLTEIWKLGLRIAAAGKVISWWFNRYCELHNITPEYLDSLQEVHPGLGTLEKSEERRERLLEAKVEQLAIDLWEEAGQPTGGHMQYLVTARESLEQRLNS